LVNRGAAYVDGRLFRGTPGRARAGVRLQDRQTFVGSIVADPTIGEVVTPHRSPGTELVFIGTAIGDMKGVKGRMYAIAADTGRIVWEPI